ncbi:ClbS/DfsB family four-helix bundle protein [Arcticibacter sp. MXS-1]|uniref:ClbS/DfsB family four-helix bundle protein n=1 Tax=Arcticibacter sp. MXS-1 TaxID=3341726 RepID=UPI0035A94385
MPVPQNKKELIAAIELNFAKLLKELDGLTESVAQERSIEGHVKDSVITLKELLAYLLGWGQLVLKWNKGKEGGLPVDFPETGYKWNELGKLACKFYNDYEGLTYNEVKEALMATVSDIMELIDRKTDEELYQEDWYGKWTLGRMIQFNTSSPYSNARNRIRKWKKKSFLKFVSS